MKANLNIFQLCQDILFQYQKISGHVTLMWNIVLCLNKYLLTNLYKFALKIFLFLMLFVFLMLFSCTIKHVTNSIVSNLCNAA